MIKMKGKKKYLVSILLTCLIAGQIAISYAEDYTPHLQVSAKNIYLTAGVKGNVTIQLYNTGNYDITEIDALVISSTPGLSVLTNTHQIINKIVGQDTVYYNVTLYVDQGLSIGTYNLSYQTTYLRLGRSITLTVPITIIVNNAFQPRVKLTVSPSTLIAGETTTIAMKIENISEENISKVNIILSSNSPLLSIENQLNYQSELLYRYDNALFEVKIKALESTPIGAYSLNAITYYSDESENRFKQTINLPLEVTTPSLPISSIITVTNLSTNMVSPGNQIDIILKFSCSGASIYNGKASISLDQRGLLSPVSPTNLALGDLNPGETIQKTYSFLLNGAAPAGEIPLSVSIRYIDSRGIQNSANEIITVPVRQIVDFMLLQDVVVSAEIGKTSTFEGDLLLIGTSRVEFTKIQIVEEGPVIKVAGSVEYVGAVDPDSPVPFQIKFGIKNSTTTGTNNLKLNVTYMDNRNNPQEKTLNIPLSIVQASLDSKSTNDNGGIWGWIRRLFGLG